MAVEIVVYKYKFSGAIPEYLKDLYIKHNLFNINYLLDAKSNIVPIEGIFRNEYSQNSNSELMIKN